ncbi:zinc transporter ZntB [Sphingomonas sp.]|uniref:zinc transporter ZntB n=1 Tax=Sphingomonas sp. TaxID=28214 RepID=UPI0025E1F105|nr:zinc transporter ZntB [Sphingomonas sp.]
MSARNYVVNGCNAAAVGLDEATAAMGTADLVWVHLDGNDPKSHDWLNAQGLPNIVVNALVATETRPRTDLVENGAILNMRGPDLEATSFPDMLASVRIWATHGRIISLTMRDLLALETLDEDIMAGKILDPGDLVCVLATAITAELDPDVAELGDVLDDCEEMFDAQNAFTMRRTIARTRAKAIAYRRFVAPQRQALEKLARIEAEWLTDDDRAHLGEAADRAARMAEELEQIRERSALMHEQLTDLRAELIDTRSLVISVVALVFLPLTFLTGLLGMNVDGIPYAHEPWAFAAVCGVSAALAIGVAAYFIRAKWFR